MGEWLQDDPLAPELVVVDLPPEREYPDADRLSIRDEHMAAVCEVFDAGLVEFEALEDQLSDRGLMVVRK
jgi:hypothetical protein